MYTCRLPLGIPKSLVSELGKFILYIDNKITGYNFEFNEDNVIAIRLNTFDYVNPLILEKKLNLLIKNDTILKKEIGSNILWNSQKRQFNQQEDIYQKLIDAGWLNQSSIGQYSIGGPALSLFRYLDHCINYMNSEKFNAIEYQYPTLLPMETLKKCGVLHNFPQLIFFLTHIHQDINCYQQFLDESTNDQFFQSFCSRFGSEIEYCLPPTMCYHTFQQLQDTTISYDKCKVYTAVGKSFRFETGYANTLERLWDFTIRETVFFGNVREVLESRELFFTEFCNLINRLHLVGYACSANDIFFLDKEAANKMQYQNDINSKYEIRLKISENKDIAVGSFNFHSNFFNKNFNIRSDKTSELCSGCTGIGLERFVYAFLCQHGMDVNKWPIKI